VIQSEAVRVVVLAASSFGLRCIEAVRSHGMLAGVVTAPRTFSISYRPEGVTNVLYADIASYCSAQQIPHAVLGDAAMHDRCLLDQVRAWQPDAFVVAGWYHIVPAAWRALAPCYGLHASLLPDYSGGAPLVWAIMRGETRTGITLFQMDGGVDTGPIVGQSSCAITDDDTIATLYARIESLGLELLNTHLPALASGRAAMTPQDESRRRRYPQRGPEDGRIDWSQSAADLYNFIRAQTRPYPGAFMDIGGTRYHVWASRVVSGPSPRAVRTGDGWLELLDVTVNGAPVDEWPSPVT
jgi:methionyl-tRNA formyltransferase